MSVATIDLPNIPQSDAATATIIANAVDPNGLPYTGQIDHDTLMAARSQTAVYSFSKVISSAEILAMNTTPIALGLTVPSGYYIKPLSCDLRMQFNTTSYNNEVVVIQAVGSTVPVYATTLEDTISVFRSLEEGSFNFDSVKYVANADFEVYAPSANPTSGDSDITIYLTYLVIAI